MFTAISFLFFIPLGVILFIYGLLAQDRRYTGPPPPQNPNASSSNSQENEEELKRVRRELFVTEKEILIEKQRHQKITKDEYIDQLEALKIKYKINQQ